MSCYAVLCHVVLRYAIDLPKHPGVGTTTTATMPWGKTKKSSFFTRASVPLTGAFVFWFYLHHVWWMWTVKFDYGYNMKVALVMGLAHTSLWLRYCYRIRRRPYAR
ncbi:unnamed protein product, partial [Discosporangium mesarthrocarpum]